MVLTMYSLVANFNCQRMKLAADDEVLNLYFCLTKCRQIRNFTFQKFAEIVKELVSSTNMRIFGGESKSPIQQKLPK